MVFEVFSGVARSSRMMLIEDYISAIWTIRYNDYGDFELVLPLTKKYVTGIKNDYLIGKSGSNRLMIVERIEIRTDYENGHSLIVSGRSFASVLERRIIASQFNFEGTVENAMREVIIQNCTGEKRGLAFTLGGENGYTEKINIQVSYAVVGEWIKQQCKAIKCGFKIERNRVGDDIVFNFYKGSYRAKAVVFSSEYENISNINYYTDTTNYCNTCYVGGEGEGTDRKIAEFGEDEKGISLREFFVDARDLSSNTGTISELQYQMKLADRGFEELNQRITETSLSAQVTNTSFKYPVDYDIGDVVKIVTDYGIEAEARIIEIIESDGQDGYKIVPTVSTTEV